MSILLHTFGNTEVGFAAHDEITEEKAPLFRQQNCIPINYVQIVINL